MIAHKKYIGRLRASSDNSTFFLFDAGVKLAEQKAGEPLRNHFCTVLYNQDLNSDLGRRITAYLPTLDASKPKAIAFWRDSEHKKENIEFEYAQQLLSRSNALLEGKQPKEEMMLFKSKDGNQASLDYHGRVSQPSQKNFQLVDEFDKSRIYCQFGRDGKNSFNLDVAYPLSIYQAFGLALSTMDFKPKK